MTEPQARLVDSLCKIIATFALVVGGGWTLYTYFNAREAEAKTATIEAKKPFLAKRLEVYSEIIDLASQIFNTATDIGDKRNKEDISALISAQAKNQRRFWDLTWGLANVVADKNAQTEVLNFASCMETFDHSQSNEICGEGITRLNKLVDACRDSLAEEWQVQLSDGKITKENLDKMRH